MRGEFYQQLTNDLETARAEGLFKEERIITSAQQADITVADGSHVINFCANNYLGLANHPDLIAAAKAGMDSHGFGVRSIKLVAEKYGGGVEFTANDGIFDLNVYMFAPQNECREAEEEQAAEV